MSNVIQKYKHQQFQTDACDAICNVFIGQPNINSNVFLLDPGNSDEQSLISEVKNAYANHEITISEDQLRKNIIQEQNKNGIVPINGSIRDAYNELNLSVEMETGTGKTYVYIKTIHELHKRYGWTKFIIIVPSIAIREGVLHSLKTMEEHFKLEYDDTVNFFVYDASHLQDIEDFATSEDIQVMVVNTQAFATKKEENRVFTDEQPEKFNGRKPIDIIAKTRPIIILDEPQTMMGAVTVQRMREFKALFILRYSATHHNEYNMMYRLDSIDAYNKNLVKKIAVNGVVVRGDLATNGYVYVSKIDVRPGKNPTVWLEIDRQGEARRGRKIMRFEQGDNLYDKSGNLAEYEDRWIVNIINGEEKTVSFLNGIELEEGKSIGDMNEEQLRRIQIRKTIDTHLKKEEYLFGENIKVLSLFFIDEVAKYRPNNNEVGVYKKIFEEEYQYAMERRLEQLGLNPDYEEFLKQTNPETCNEGYFSKDKKGRLKDTNGNTDADKDSYDLIMKNKERLLSFDEPVRFIFSHSALKEGWDNTNVFQICALKNNDVNNTRLRQEIGRGMRLCVNQNGDRMDETEVGERVHDINVLTVIAPQNYEEFARRLQEEYNEATQGRLQKITEDVFVGKTVHINGEEHNITKDEAGDIVYHFTVQQYIDKNGKLTQKYYDAIEDNNFVVPTGFDATEIIQIANKTNVKIIDDTKRRVRQQLNNENFNKKEFQELWNLINQKSFYTVDFKTEDLVDKAVDALNNNLHVMPVVVEITESTINKISDNAELQATKHISVEKISSTEIIQPFDLIGEIAKGTDLTRKVVAQILTNIDSKVFNKFKENPQDFIKNAIDLINETKAVSVIEHIEYNPLEERFSIDIFTKQEKNLLESRSICTPNHNIYNRLVYDSDVEKKFTEDLESHDDVCVYVKLPKIDFYINTPFGKYYPDWAIAFKKGHINNICFVVETKATPPDELESNLKDIEKAKIKCAKKHFAKISGDKVKYGVVDNYDTLLKIIMK